MSQDVKYVNSPIKHTLDNFKKQKHELLSTLGNFEERKKNLISELEDIQVLIICVETLDEAINELKERLENKRKGN